MKHKFYFELRDQKITFIRSSLLILASFALLCLILSCNRTVQDDVDLDALAENYVRLALQVGQYDPDFVDAYYGPTEWKPKEPPAAQIPEELVREVNELISEIEDSALPNTMDEIARFYVLRKQCLAMQTKLNMLTGQNLSFDVEAEKLYDATPPHHELAYFDDLLAELDLQLSGPGTLSDRYHAFSNQFIIPREKLDTVFQTAIKEARRRTKLHFLLPENENFELEYVKDKSWSGYNYYQGNSYSLIQINTDFPIYIERALDLACHEGYPGHHVYNSLLERNLVKDKGWLEFSLYPLFSPQSFIAEGSANYGIELAFPHEEKLLFEKNVLYPLAGIDTSLAHKYFQIQNIRKKLNYAGNEAARAYLNGEISREGAAEILEKYLLYEPDRALQRTRFIDQYRSYVINYNLGQDIVANFIRQEAGMDYDKRWEIFEHLLSNPTVASMIVTE